jgi:hypothetical protein
MRDRTAKRLVGLYFFRGFIFMCSFSEADGARRLNSVAVRERQTMQKDRFWLEQKKLERLVTAFFEDGRFNMGTDNVILMQSRVVDQLMAEEMLFDDEEYLSEGF